MNDDQTNMFEEHAYGDELANRDQADALRKVDNWDHVPDTPWIAIALVLYALYVAARTCF